ncbi:thiamine phosphate synthase [Robertmurraya sp. GLU-23]
MEYLKLYFIMGSQDCMDRTPEETLALAIKGGITCFQYREKGSHSLGEIEKYELGKKLRELCAEHKVPFIVNDDLPLAIALDADGVHVGQDDENAKYVRETIGPNKILGVSTHTIEEGLQAVRDGADYLGIGPMYPTISKEDTEKQQNLDIFTEFRNAGISLPLIAIGGINSTNGETVMKVGANGLAIISDICRASHIQEHTKLLRRLVDEF